MVLSFQKHEATAKLFLGVTGDIHFADIGFPVRDIQSIQLALQKIRGHVMPLARHQALEQQGLRSVQKDKARIPSHRLAKKIAIGFLQCRTSRNGTIGLFRKSGADPPQPWPAILIGQWNSAGHFLDIVWAVQRVSFKKRNLIMLSQSASERRLATAADAHHDYMHLD